MLFAASKLMQRYSVRGLAVSASISKPRPTKPAQSVKRSPGAVSPQPPRRAPAPFKPKPARPQPDEEALSSKPLQPANTATREPADKAGIPRPVPLRISDFDVNDPTYVPRNTGITDGEWSTMDRRMVQRAQSDATEAVKETKVNADGLVLLGKSVQELRNFAASMGEPEYRGRQLYDAMLQGARSMDAITVIPKTWRQALINDGVRTGRSIVHHSVQAPDGTRKFLLQLHDGRVVETVGIPADDADKPRLTVCVSSQVGCPMRCTFCATGKGGFARNLMMHEIVDQVLTMQEAFGRRVSNVVFMGMGEPLLNLPAVHAAFRFMNEDMGIGARNITLSTVGVPNAISKLARLHIKATLAISIHAPNQELRQQIVPSARAYPLEALVKECQDYFQTTGRRLTFEYTLLKGVNDSPALAEELASLLKRHDMASHVNLIPWNPVSESEFARPTRNDVGRFKKVLEKRGVEVSVRAARGLEAAAACGQLRNEFQKKPLESFDVPA